jgi:hypothetical protein
VYTHYMDFIKLFVNLCSYTPQVVRATAAATNDISALYKEIVGAMPGTFRSEGSWQGSLTSSFDHLQAPRLMSYELGDADQTILKMLKQQPAREI